MIKILIILIRIGCLQHARCDRLSNGRCESQPVIEFPNPNITVMRSCQKAISLTIAERTPSNATMPFESSRFDHLMMPEEWANTWNSQVETFLLKGALDTDKRLPYHLGCELEAQSLLKMLTVYSPVSLAIIEPHQMPSKRVTWSEVHRTEVCSLIKCHPLYPGAFRLDTFQLIRSQAHYYERAKSEMR